MSDPRYTAGVIQGLALSRSPGEWPTSIPGLGGFTYAPFGLCVDCKDAAKGPDAAIGGSWAMYGDKQLCRYHADHRAQAA